MEAQRQSQGCRGRTGYLDSSLEVFNDIAGTLEDATGYEVTADEGRIVAPIKDGKMVDQVEAGDSATVVLDVTPFYAESSTGRDTGWITGPDGKLRVEDVRMPVEGLIVHMGRATEGVLRVNSKVSTLVDGERSHTARHHTATHLLHKALKELLGDHVNQAGSLPRTACGLTSPL